MGQLNYSFCMDQTCNFQFLEKCGREKSSQFWRKVTVLYLTDSCEILVRKNKHQMALYAYIQEIMYQIQYIPCILVGTKYAASFLEIVFSFTQGLLLTATRKDIKFQSLGRTRKIIQECWKTMYRKPVAQVLSLSNTIWDTFSIQISLFFCCQRTLIGAYKTPSKSR